MRRHHDPDHVQVGDTITYADTDDDGPVRRIEQVIGRENQPWVQVLVTQTRRVYRRDCEPVRGEG